MSCLETAKDSKDGNPVTMIPTEQKAAQYDPKWKKVVINTIPVPDIAEDEILVKTVAASLCHSDITVVQGESVLCSDPVTIGHEAVGQIVKLGTTSQDRGFKEGDFVGFTNACHACFQCEGCKSHYMYCSGGKLRLQGFAANGYFQEYISVDSAVTVVLPDDMDPTVSSPIFCAGLTAYQAVLTTDIKPDQWLAVIGCGGLGQLAIRYATAMRYKVIGIDIDNETLKTAKDSGAVHTFNSRENKNLVEEIKEITLGGCHACAVFAAVKAGYDTAPKLLRIGGNLVPVGIAKQAMEVNTFDIALKVYRINGANNAADNAGLKACAEFTAKHKISSPSRFFKLDQIGEMCELMLKEQMGGYRLVVKFNEFHPNASGQ